MENRLDEAAQHLERACALDPKNPAAFYRLANVYRKQGKAEQAKAMWAIVTRLNDQASAEHRKGRRLRVVRDDPQPTNEKP